MCGIVAYKGSDAVKNSLNILKSLEYRGYDSCGIACNSSSGLLYKKYVGKVENLLKNVSFFPEDVKTCICHTRWATHGKVSEENTHPQIVNGIAVVHNGIIDNFLELRKQLFQNNKIFNSETDTEVIAHLISEEVGDTYTKVKNTISKLSGSYAIAVLNDHESDKIVVAKKGSPLVLAEYKNNFIASSDIQSILPISNKIIIMQDEEIAVIDSNGIDLYKNNQKINKKYINVSWNTSSVTKGKFNSFTEKEIYEQPTAIIDTVLKNDWKKIQEQINLLFNKEYFEIVVLGSGTSYHAAELGVYYLGQFSDSRCFCEQASEFQFTNRPINKNTLVIAISQSGETADTISAVKYAKSKGAKVLSIVNVIGSSLSTYSDVVVYTATGPEIGVAATKTFTSQVISLYCLSCLISKNFKIVQNSFNDVLLLSEHISKIFEQSNKIKDFAKSIMLSKSILYTGRGQYVSVAKEAALKTKELSYIPSEGISSAELKHGTIALLQENYPVIAIAVDGVTYQRALSNIHEMKTRKAKIIAVISENNTDVETLTPDIIRIPTSLEIFYPILTAISLQMLAFYVAWFKGTNVDQPRNLAKSVTVE